MSKVDRTSRTMSLLWRSEVAQPAAMSPGPKPRLEISEVVTAAIAVADANPSAGLSMRAVAEQLGVTAMALYGYVPDKGSLVALAYDAIHAEMSDSEHGDGDWRERTIAWAEDLVALFVRHPWALRVSYARPVLGPNEQRVLESLVGVLRTTDQDSDRMRRVVGLLFYAVRGTALTIAEAREAEAASGITEEDWWRTTSAALDDSVPDFADRFPNTIWLLSQQSHLPTADDGSSYVEQQSMVNFQTGLSMLLDGFEAAKSARPRR
ncbi:MAG TPA: TetR/AcrR family transcriptional regulator C-terminal domain-containing protein [Acidimicrobiia bacterium]|nr:TetR/AcrR family transcriptional regulator C-terminal domain-containing protein [Acidimicrobiia bacterium]